MAPTPTSIAELAERLGVQDPLPQGDASTVRFELGDEARLLDDADPRLRRALAEETAPAAAGALATATARALAGALGWSTARAVFADGVAALREWLAARGRTLRVDGVALDAVPPDLTDVAVLEVEPRTRDDAGMQRLRELCRAAARRGVAVVVDETRTAFRTAAATVTAAAELPADAVLFGPSCALGRPFAAIVPRASGALDGASAQLAEPSPLSLALAGTVVRALREQPVHTELAAFGSALREHFAARCAAEALRARLCGPDAALEIDFDGQENASPALMREHFVLELAKVGVRTGGVLCADARCLVRLPAVLDALGHATGRIRTLLIEHNSYLCGGVPWVFVDGDPRLRERGLAIYRYPKLGAVDVEPAGERMRIRFAAGPLGEITSSGFWVPTRIRGDFDVSVEYELPHWRCGPDSACVALFAQNEASTHRYYAQRMTTGDAPDAHSVAAGLEGGLSARTPVAAMQGWFRLVRRGGELSAWHRAAGQRDWLRLGSKDGATRDDVIVGVKIWSKVRSGGLEALLGRLSIEAEIPADQIARLDVRPDPRAASGAP